MRLTSNGHSTLNKKVLIVLVLGLVFSNRGMGQPHTGGELLYTFQYDGFFYDGHRYPNPNPNLILRFTFRTDGISHLKWFRTDEPGWCERKADYQGRKDTLYQKVIWLNPANRADCSRDPDMQLNKETESRFSVENDELHLFFDLNGKEFIYILRRCGSAGQNVSAHLKIAQSVPPQRASSFLSLAPRSHFIASWVKQKWTTPQRWISRIWIAPIFMTNMPLDPMAMSCPYMWAE